jgi:hypothetical protein
MNVDAGCGERVVKAQKHLATLAAVAAVIAHAEGKARAG